MPRLLLGLLLLVIADALDLGSAGGAWVEDVTEPLLGEVAGQFNAYDALTKAEDLAVVGKDGSLDAEGVHGGGGANALDLVSGDGDTDACAAHEEATVGFAPLDHAGSIDAEVRVGWWAGEGWYGGSGCRIGTQGEVERKQTLLVGLVVNSNVVDGGDAGVSLEVLLELILVFDAGVCDCDSKVRVPA